MEKVAVVGGIIAGWEVVKRLYRGLDYYGRATDRLHHGQSR